MIKRSTYAIELNEAMDPGCTTPERVWANAIANELRFAVRKTPPWHGFLGKKVATYTDPDGDVFAVRFVRWIGDGRQEQAHAINGEPCDPRTFEVRISEHYGTRETHVPVERAREVLSAYINHIYRGFTNTAAALRGWSWIRHIPEAERPFWEEQKARAIAQRARRSESEGRR